MICGFTGCKVETIGTCPNQKLFYPSTSSWKVLSAIVEGAVRGSSNLPFCNAEEIAPSTKAPCIDAHEQ
jgi:hypothetical protein